MLNTKHPIHQACFPYFCLMRTNSLIIAGVVVLSLFLMANSTCNKKKKVQVSFTQTSAYCGGAAPNEKLLQELNTPKPLTGVMLHVLRKGDKDKNMIHVILSESNLELLLKNGTYEVFKEMNEDVFNKVDKVKDEELKMCLMEWYMAPKATFEVTDETTSIEVNIHADCNPCYPPAP